MGLICFLLGHKFQCMESENLENMLDNTKYLFDGKLYHYARQNVIKNHMVLPEYRYKCERCGKAVSGPKLFLEYYFQYGGRKCQTSQ